MLLGMESLVIERSGGVLSVMLNRPQKKNAVDGPMWRGLAEVFREAGLNDEDRVVVVSGAGGDFCAGADLSDSEALSTHALVRMRMIGQAALALHALPKPTIAKVDGVCVGAGCNLALGCDLVVASDRARFSEIFAKRGLSIDFGGSWLLPRRIGLHKAKELALLADIIDADEADRIGLVNRVVPVADLDSFVADWAARLAAGPPLALSLTKSLLDESMSMSMAEALEREAAAQAVNSASEDGREAVLAFLNKRDAHFSGR
jgi:2-(1,2-epoxy-1,2-dihydrophenyl)acetyl-CoA isomerase